MMMVPNTNELPPEIYRRYKEELLETQTFRYNEHGVLTPTNFFLKNVNSFIASGLDKEIKVLAPTITKSLIISACLLPFHRRNNQKEDFFHILNISLENMNEPQIENTQFSKFWGWMEYFFEPVL